MSIHDLGSIGELVATIATVATLIYLALQIRENTMALRVEARRSEMQGASAYTSAIVGSPEVARILNAGLVDPTSLRPEEVTRFSFLLGNFLGAEAGAFEESRGAPKTVIIPSPLNSTTPEATVRRG